MRDRARARIESVCPERPMIGLSLLVSVVALAAVGTYQPPTAAPVSDPFRPPPKPWMAGNRGLEYATEPGSAVRAIGAGRVAFAGPVAGRNVVAIVHPDGLRSTYTELAGIEVRTGQQVVGGATVGRASARLHLGVRLGRTYLDPAGLWGRSRVPGRALLVPLEQHGSRAPPRPPWGARGLVTTLDRRPTAWCVEVQFACFPPTVADRNLPSVLRNQASKKPLERRGS